MDKGIEMNHSDVYEETPIRESHSVIVGYLFWIFGFTGSHRFYYGKPWTGLLWLCTLGLLGIGWIVDLFLIPSMHSEACARYHEGQLNYQVAWALFVFTGVFGGHRFYMQKWISAVIYLCTGAFFGLGLLYDYVQLNEELSVINAHSR